MPQRVTISHIIDALDRGQVRYIRPQLRGDKLRLFDILVARKKIITLEQAAQMLGLKGNSFSSVKHQLEIKVVTLLGGYRLKHSPQAKVQALRNRAKGYLALRLYEEAAEAFMDSVRIAEEFEEFEAGLESDAAIRTYLPSLVSSDQDQRRLHFLQLQHDCSQAFNLLQEAESVKRMTRRDVKIKASEELNLRLMALSNMKSKRANLARLKAEVICLVIQRQVQAAKPLLEDALRIIESSPSLLHNDQTQNFASSLVTAYSGICTVLKEPEKSLAVLDGFELTLRTLGYSLPQGMIAFRLLCQLEAIATGKSSIELDDVLLAIKEMPEPDSAIDQKQHMQFVMGAIHCLMKKGRHDDAMTWILRFRQLRVRKENVFWAAACSILELVCLTDAGRYADLSQSSRRAVYRLEKSGAPTAFIKIIVSTFNQIVIRPLEKKFIAQRMLTLLDSYPDKLEVEPLLETTSLIVWARKL